MLRLKRSPLYRLLAKATAAAVCLSALSLAAPPQPADAQGVAAVTTAIILDFQVAEGLDASLGRRAADSVAMELTNRGDYDIRSRAEVETAMTTLFGRVIWDLPPTDQQRLAAYQDLDVDRIITGRVVTKSVAENPPTARIQMTVIERDRVSGEPVNGALVRTVATRLQGVAAAEVLVDEALNKGASEAVDTMQRFILPTGRVLVLARNNQIVINRGANHGVEPGMKFAVTRETGDLAKNVMIKEKVGTIVIDQVDPEQATGHTTEQLKGIQSMDKVTAVYTLPDVVRPGPLHLTERQKQRAKTGLWSKFAMPVLFVLGLASLTSLSGGEAGKATAAPKQLTAQTGSQPLTTLIRFDNPSELSKTRILAYLIYRSEFSSFIPDTTTLIDVVQATEPQYLDTGNWYDVDANITVEEDSGIISDFTIDKTPVVVPSTTRQALGQNIGTDFAITTQHAGLQAGRTYYYKVVRLTVAEPPIQPTISQGSSGGGGGGGGGSQQSVGFQFYLSDPSATAGPATALQEASLVSPPNAPAAGSDTVNLGNATFEWLAVDRANEYIVQVSDDARFPTGRVWQSDVDEGIRVQTSAAAGTQMSRTFTTLDNFAPFLNSRTFFWRVGVRNSLDALAPVGNYLFNAQPYSFTTLEPPPNPPSGTRSFRAARTPLQKPASGAAPSTIRKER